MAQHGGRRSIAVLNSTTEFHPLTWSPVDTDAADFARLTLSQIALMFGLPPGMLGGPTGDTLTYSTNEMRMLELYQLTLLPWIGRIEAVLNAQLPAGTKPRIEVDGLFTGRHQDPDGGLRDRDPHRRPDRRRGPRLREPSPDSPGRSRPMSRPSSTPRSRRSSCGSRTRRNGSSKGSSSRGAKRRS